MKLNINMRSCKRMLGVAAVAIAAVSMTSCDDYLNELPVKGEKNPKNYSDLTPLLNYEYGNCYTDCSNAFYLLNDRYLEKNSLAGDTYTKAIYMWNEGADRAKLLDGYESFYDSHYSGIGAYNLLIDMIPSSENATAEQKAETVAYARALRAYSYHVLVTYYADAYLKNKDARGVPVILSSEVMAPHSQWSVGKLYDFIVAELTDVLKTVPTKSPNVLHPNAIAVHAMLSRVYLNMGKYAEALKEAETVLAAKGDLFDWNAYYTANQAKVDDPNTFTNVLSPVGYNYNETLFHRSNQNTNMSRSEWSMPVERAAKFEDGDTKFKVRWKLRTVNQDTYYWGQINGYHNNAGLTTTEVYLIKAECLARTGKVKEGMDVVNKVRKTRVLPAKYADLTATDAKDALAKIISVKDNEMIMTMVPFMDMKRLNAEGQLKRTLTKVYDGKTYTLAPDSKMWNMAFPGAAVKTPGNGAIEQNF